MIGVKTLQSFERNGGIEGITCQWKLREGIVSELQNVNMISMSLVLSIVSVHLLGAYKLMMHFRRTSKLCIISSFVVVSAWLLVFFVFFLRDGAFNTFTRRETFLDTGWPVAPLGVVNLELAVKFAILQRGKRTYPVCHWTLQPVQPLNVPTSIFWQFQPLIVEVCQSHPVTDADQSHFEWDAILVKSLLQTLAYLAGCLIQYWKKQRED